MNPNPRPEPPRIHLIANSHIDPMYMWQWDEGVAEALSTFRSAVELCEEHAEFVFNHNEAYLYDWIRRLDPSLFARIQRMVAAGRWHIMGGWFVQPDCNLPCGESFVRQILAGRTFFERHFGVRPRASMNFDSFGHTRGLVQILRKTGFDGYLFCRPTRGTSCPLPGDDFVWVGFDGSEVLGHRSNEHYNSEFGEAGRKLSGWLSESRPTGPGLFLWGVGNHGGGPSRKDVVDLRVLIADDGNIRHSTPDAFFDDLAADRERLPRFDGDLNPVAEGCYTTLARVKQKHRTLENELYSTEKMLACCALQGLLSYPNEELTQALEDLLLGEFHDALAGSMTRDAEQDTLRTLDHGLEIVSRLKFRAFHALTAGQPRVNPSESVFLAFNPHPYPVRGRFECECGLPPNRKSLGELDRQGGGTGVGFTLPVLRCDGKPVPCQLEKEHCHKPWDWRKRVVFEAELPPFAMTRFDCAYRFVPVRPSPALRPGQDGLTVRTERLEVLLNPQTGLMDRLRVDGRDFLREGSFRPLLVEDRHDAYGWGAGSFPKVAAAFRAMTPDEVRAHTGFADGPGEALRVVEDGEVRTVVESLLVSNASTLCLRYVLPKRGTEFEVELRVSWNEKGRMLKLAVPTTLSNVRFEAQTSYGAQTLASDGREHYVHKWAGLFDDTEGVAITWINDGVHGCDCHDGELRISLLRSTLYLGSDYHPTCPPPKDRTYPRIDQGDHVFRFWLNAGGAAARRATVDREALARNEKPYVLALCPSGEGTVPQPLAVLDDDVLQLAVFKQAEAGDDYILRLFEPTGTPRRALLRLPIIGVEQELALGPFEVQTWRLDPHARTLRPQTMDERPV